MPYAAKARILEYELVLKAIAALTLNDETPLHSETLALYRTVQKRLDSKGIRELFNSAALPPRHTTCAVRES